MAFEPGSPGIKLSLKKPRFCTDYDKCIKCQGKKNEKLQAGIPSSVIKFIQSAKWRNDEIFRRIEPDLENDETLDNKTVKWHKSCYSAYTSTENMRYQVPLTTVSQDTDHSSSSSGVTLRSSETTVNWDLCLVCQKVKCKGEKALTQVVTKKVYETLMGAAEYRNDESMKTKIRDMDLIALKTKYHRGCYQRYTVAASSTKANIDHYEQAFLKLTHEMGHKLIEGGRAYDMATLVIMYKRFLIEAGIEEETAELYKTQNLKKRLIAKYGEKIAFHQYGRNKSEHVCSSSLNLGEIINFVAELKDLENQSPMSSSNKDTRSQILYHAAVILRSEMTNVVGIETQPLNVSDLNTEKAKNLVPAKLQCFLRWLMQSQRSFNDDQLPIDDESNFDEARVQKGETRKVLSIAQDIVACYSGGRKKMPKHVGLGLAIKTMVRGKEIIQMLNHLGHSINYWECQQVETEWAEMSLKQFDDSEGYYQAILPSNIVKGTFAQSAADNVDFIQDTVDGKESVHIMSLAYYQGGFPLDPKKILPQSNVAKVRHRALKSAETKFYELPFISNTPAPTILRKAKRDFFMQCATERETLEGLNRAWIFTRNTPTRLLDVQIEQPETRQRVPGWTGFHAVVTMHESIPTRIGFPPMIPAPVKDPNTVYTCLKSLEKTFRNTLEQGNAVVTFDEGLYCEAKRIQWAVSPELDNMVIRLGGFHRAKNFIGVIGKRIEESGIEDLWIESDICGNNVAAKIISGTHYNRAIRAHKLTLEALERLQWKYFLELLEKHYEVNETALNDINNKKQELTDLFQSGHDSVVEHREEIQKQVVELSNLLTVIFGRQFKQYKVYGCQRSALFAFWNEYMEMVWLLLNFVHGDRDGNWRLHLETFNEMLPYDRAFDHLNYFRWGTVYITDMKRLPDVAPNVHREFTENRAHAVSTSSSQSAFNCVSPDMALEQTINKDSKTKGGIVGVSGMEETRDKWALSAHMMAAATTAVKVMSGLSTASSFQKELGIERIERDEKDIQNIIQCINTKMANPFDISKYEGEKIPLINIATGAVPPCDVSESLLTAKAQGEKAMAEFIQNTLVSGEKDFWSPLKKLNVKTFQSLNKPINVVGKAKEAIKVINIDRRIYSRLLVVSKDRDVDLKEVQSYELAPVPLSLANLDGSLRKPNKSLLLKELDIDNLSQSLLPTATIGETSYIIDLLAIIQMLSKGKMKTFGELSNTIAGVVLSKFQVASYVHVVPDRYDVVDSIKAGERSRRLKENPVEIKILSRATKLPTCLKRYLSSGKNKSNLLSFLVSDWLDNIPSQLKENEVLYLALQDGSAVKVTNSTTEDVPLLHSDHEEADSRIFVHCEYFTNQPLANSTKRIIIFSPDTDVAALCWHHFLPLRVEELWFHTGTGRNKRFIPVHRTVQKLGEDICTLLPAMHSLTGCDSTSSLQGIGKKGAFSVLRKHKNELVGLSSLGTHCSVIDDPTLKACLKFIGLLYGEATDDLNQLRYSLFTKKNVESGRLPPTEDSAFHHIKRANYQCFIWKHAREQNLMLTSPVGSGWSKDDNGCLIPKLMQNDPAPQSVLQLVVCGCKKGCNARCSCRKVHLSCTVACSCSKDCTNNQEEVEEDEEMD